MELVFATYEIRHLRTLHSFQCLQSPVNDSICKVVSFSISKSLMPALHLATSLLVFWHALIFFPHIVSPFFATACHHPSLTPDPSQLPSELFTLNTLLNRIVRRSKVLLEILHTVLLELSNISPRATTFGTPLPLEFYGTVSWLMVGIWCIFSKQTTIQIHIMFRKIINGK